MNNTPNTPTQQYVQVMDANGALHSVPANQLIPVADATGKVEYKPAYMVQYAAQPVQPQYVQVMDSTGKLQTVPANQLIPVADASGKVEYKPAYAVQWSQPVQPAFGRSASQIYTPSYVPAGMEYAKTPSETAAAAAAYAPTIIMAQPDPEDLEDEIPADAPTEPRKGLRQRCSRAGWSVFFYILLSEFATILSLLLFALPTIIQSFSSPEVVSAMAQSTGEGLDAIRQYVVNSAWYEKYFFFSLLASSVGAILASTIPFFYFAKKCGTVTDENGKIRRELNPFSFYGKGKYVPGLIIKGFVFGIATSFVWSLLYALLSFMLPSSGISNSNMGLDFPTDTASIVLYAVRVCLLAPILEEFMFRGVLLKGLSKYGNGFAVAVTAILFGLLHGNVQQTPFAAIIGIVLGYIAVRTGNIWSSMAVHCLINSFSTLMALGVSRYADSDFILVMISVMAIIIELGCVITAIVLLIKAVSDRKIKWRPVDKERCSILLPKVRTEAKHKMINCLTTPGLIVCILACIGLIALSFYS